MPRSVVPVLLPGDPTLALHAATKQYVDAITPQKIGAAQGVTPVARSSNATANLGELVLADASGGPITITAPAITADGQRFAVKKVDTTANVVTVQAASGQTIGSAGATSIPIRLPDQAGTYQSFGSNWVIPHGYQSLAQLDLRYAALAHSHDASAIITGVLDLARIPGHSSTHAPGAADDLSTNYVNIGGTQNVTGQKTIPSGSGNSWIFNQPVQVAQGTLAQHAARRDDPKFLPSGGSSGQVLAKTSATDYAVGWVTPATGGGTPAAHASTHLPGGSDEIYSPIRTVTAATSVVDTDCVVLGNTSSAGFTITLPSASGRTGKRFIIKKPGANTANPLSINSNGGTIDGATTETISVAGGFRELVSDGTNWHIVSGKVEPVIISLGTFGSSSTIAIDASIGNVYRATASGNTTLGVPTNPVDGDVIEVQILTSAALTITISSSILLAGGANASLSMASGKRWFGSLRFVSGVGWFLVGSAAQA